MSCGLSYCPWMVMLVRDSSWALNRCNFVDAAGHKIPEQIQICIRECQYSANSTRYVTEVALRFQCDCCRLPRQGRAFAS